MMKIFLRIHLYRLSLLLLAVLFFATSCKKEEVDDQLLYQVSTINALLQGVYDGHTSLETLKSYGDFGIGTFNALDGEMILLDGSYYQVKADGKVYQPANSAFTPFASVTYFNPEVNHEINAKNYTELKSKIDELIISPNLFYAIKLSGEFEYIKTRSVPAQEKPYPPLIEVTANQPEFESENISGTLSGFFCPTFVNGVNVAGYHLHFLSDDKQFGGHVLEIKLKRGTLYLDQINNYQLMLPDEGGFLDTNLEDDMSDDLEDVEGGSSGD